MCLLREKRKKNPLNARRGQLCGSASGKGRESGLSALQVKWSAGQEEREGGEARGSGYVDIRSKVRGKQREKAKGQKQSESL